MIVKKSVKWYSNADKQEKTFLVRRYAMADKKELYGYEEEDIITLEFDDGEDVECGILGVFDALDKEYIALNPLGTEDVYIYGYKDLDDEYELIDITDDDEFNKVVAEFEKLAVEEV